MQRILAILFLVVSPLPAGDKVEHARTPVVVELFTSEGCSSCPPADALLTKLNDQQTVAGVQVIALEEHVDYWDRNGWRDPFSSAEFTARQKNYVQRLHLESAYTPQMVIDGCAEVVGNDSRAALQELAKAARGTRIPVRLTLGEKSADHVSLAVQVEAARSSGTVVAAITESKLATDVVRGENAGHNLKHSAVVRKLIAVGALKKGEAFSVETVVQLAPEWKPENLSVIVFVQEGGSGKTLGATEIALAR
jgi:hypothetical protein